ncbi:MAG TPA: hypothetical protein VK163_07055, partial [Opitutaceae bacterium]|nr:hypothetical protein [Opitutaceae bacterium]
MPNQRRRGGYGVGGESWAKPKLIAGTSGGEGRGRGVGGSSIEGEGLLEKDRCAGEIGLGTETGELRLQGGALSGKGIHGIESAGGGAKLRDARGVEGGGLGAAPVGEFGEGFGAELLSSADSHAFRTIC